MYLRALQGDALAITAYPTYSTDRGKRPICTADVDNEVNTLELLPDHTHPHPNLVLSDDMLQTATATAQPSWSRLASTALTPLWRAPGYCVLGPEIRYHITQLGDPSLLHEIWHPRWAGHRRIFEQQSCGRETCFWRSKVADETSQQEIVMFCKARPSQEVLTSYFCHCR